MTKKLTSLEGKDTSILFVEPQKRKEKEAVVLPSSIHTDFTYVIQQQDAVGRGMK